MAIMANLGAAKGAGSMKARFAAGAAMLGLALLVLAACAYRGGIDNPAIRRVAWFSYLDGDDIRTYCVENAPDSYRLVYNGRYEEQLRSYELAADGAGGANLTARAMAERGDLTEISLDDVLAPWRWRTFRAHLDPADFQAFQRRLETDGMYAGAPAGLRLFSGDFYWVASGCRNGRFYYGAWLHPEPPFQRLTFPEFLYARDSTGVPVNPPRPLPPADKFRTRGQGANDSETRFWLQVHENGLGSLTNF
jgi:hypothetical protein